MKKVVLGGFLALVGSVLMLAVLIFVSAHLNTYGRGNSILRTMEIYGLLWLAIPAVILIVGGVIIMLIHAFPEKEER